MSDERVHVQVLLLYGEWAELLTPWHTTRAPLRVLAATIAADAGMPENELPGRRFTAAGGPKGLREFRLANDPRL